MRAVYILTIIAIFAILPTRSAWARVSPFGVQLHTVEGNVGEHRTALELCKQAGVELVRDEIRWNKVEHGQGILKIDENALLNVEDTWKANIETLLVLDCRNPLYGNDPTSEAATEGFARYCEFMARTFKGKVKYWEVRGERAAEKSKPGARKYVNLLKSAYKACKKGNRDCVVIGLSPSEIPAEEVLGEGAAKYMDALSVHRRSEPSEMSKLAADLLKLRELMDKHGAKGKPIWITEIGGPISGETKAIASDEQANLQARTSVEAISAGVESVFWRWLGDGGSTGEKQPDGIPLADRVSKPAYNACGTMIRFLTGAKFARTLWIDKSTRAHVFTRDKSDTAVLWCADGVRTVTLGVEGEAAVADGLGAEQEVTLTPANGMVTITLTETPSYVILQFPIQQVNIMPGNPFQFLPPNITLAAGAENSIGIGAVNMGMDTMGGKIRILSDLVSPQDHDFSLRPGERALLISQLSVPADASGDLRIPALVEFDGKPCAKLELLVKVTPPARR